MLGVITLLVILGVNLGFMIYCLCKKGYHKEIKHRIHIAMFSLLLILLLFHIVWWSFRWYLLFLILFIQTVIALWNILRKNNRKEKIFKKRYVIISFIGSVFLFTFAVFPAILFPQFVPIKATGNYAVKSVSYTLTDPNRIETFSDTGENRKVTIQFWYPDNVNEKYPLVIFSHGSFGFRGSNASTFEDLASNGYVVCSIDHTYHAFFTKQTDGKMVIANMDFINDAIAAENDDYDAEKTYQLAQGWLKLREDDMNFVLNSILSDVSNSASDEVYKLINTDEIGLFGHSLGGATAAALGRQRTDIDAVIDVDGTMLGEETGFENGKPVLNTTPYPVPLLNLYNENHYKDALKLGNDYDNIAATTNAVDAKSVVIKGSGHLNFTDLPMFSPFLASMLDTGKVDSRYCIETMNQVILEYFNHYLKGVSELNLQTEY